MAFSSQILHIAHLVLQQGKKLVVYAGTLEPYQGIELLIAGCQTVMQKEPDLWLLVVGGTPAQVRYYQQVAQDLGILERCQFTGRVTPELARQYGNLATVQVSPRISGTNTPLKIYQQISLGIPLVATKIASHTQVLDENVAFLVEPTSAGIAAGITAALAPGLEPRQKAARAQQLYEERYSRQIYKDKMREVLAYFRDPLTPAPTPSLAMERQYLIDNRGER